jgi:hypothetical protein
LKDGDKEDEPTTIVVDSTGISTTKKGSYIEEMWRREKRKFIKLADKKGKIVGFRVTSEKTGDTKRFVPLVKEAVKRKGRGKEGSRGHMLILHMIQGRTSIYLMN